MCMIPEPSFSQESLPTAEEQDYLSCYDSCIPRLSGIEGRCTKA